MALPEEDGLQLDAEQGEFYPEDAEPQEIVAEGFRSNAEQPRHSSVTPPVSNSSLSDYVDSGPANRAPVYIRPKSSSPDNLPIPGPGNSGYELSDYCTSSSGRDSYVPQPASDDELGHVINVMASLSTKYRGHLSRCNGLTQRIRDVKVDALMKRRMVAQETAMSLRTAQYIAFYSNTAKAWAQDAVWQYPMKLRVVDGEYEEVSTDDEGEPVHGLPEKKQCWEKYRVPRVPVAHNVEERYVPH